MRRDATSVEVQNIWQMLVIAQRRKTYQKAEKIRREVKENQKGGKDGKGNPAINKVGEAPETNASRPGKNMLLQPVVNTYMPRMR